MRSVASKAMGALLPPAGRRAHTFWVSGAVVAVVSLWRGAAAVMSDLCANSAQEFLSGSVGHVGEWLIIAVVLCAYTLHARRQSRRTVASAPRRIVSQVRRRSRTIRMEYRPRYR